MIGKTSGFRNLGIVILSEVSQTEKDKYYMTLLICRILNNDTNEFIYKTKTDSQHREETCGCQGGEV